MSVHFLRSLSVLGLSALLWGAVPPESPVADAAMRADLDKVRLLLRGGADVNVAQGDGMTALHWSAENRSAYLCWCECGGSYPDRRLHIVAPGFTVW